MPLTSKKFQEWNKLRRFDEFQLQLLKQLIWKKHNSKWWQSKFSLNTCCIFWPAFLWCVFQMLVKIFFFHVFHMFSQYFYFHRGIYWSGDIHRLSSVKIMLSNFTPYFDYLKTCFHQFSRVLDCDNQHLGISPKMLSFALSFVPFCFKILQKLAKNMWNGDFEQCLQCTAPKGWSKYTTDMRILNFFFFFDF